ncbi:hypothetical protein [Nocardioides sp. URHA0020]|uniref:hypothetical protein n=1 Tax=Nocardioides sp. URHA0020 TaxID=1380392 RepID=UPI0012DEE7AA|nr:hypothetical protein [Nocardioides sp. URHA0020]
MNDDNDPSGSARPHSHDPTPPAPPGPWRWQKVIPDSPPGFDPNTAPMGTALVAADGTWVISSETGYGTPEIDPAARELIAKAHILERLPGLIESWEQFRDASTPVHQADCLLTFANDMTHLIWDFTGQLDNPDPTQA